jgi:radical SAM protein with 4Fe4S-binding SPASM domain
VRPAIKDDTVLDLEPVLSMPSCGGDLHVAAHTASWVLLDELETSVANRLHGMTFGQLRGLYPGLHAQRLLDFLVRLYQRGLLSLDGKPGLDPGFLRDGAVFREANLVEILVTQKCNLACRYCLATAGPDMPHMHPEVAFQAVDEAFKLRDDIPLAIQLSGGEPFVNFTLFRKLVTYIEQKQQATGRTISLVTQSNATLIDDTIATFIKEHNIGIGISMDGPSQLAGSRPLLGGGPSHDRMMRGVQALRRNGVKFGVILVLNRANAGHPEDIAGFFADLDVRSIKINPISQIGDAQGTWDQTAISASEYFTFLDRFICHVMNNGLRLREANLAEYLKYLTRRMHNYRCMRSNCGAGRSFFLVDARGDVYPCAHSAGIDSWRIGTIGEASGDLAGLGQRNPQVARLNLRLVDTMEATSNCPWRHFCEGGCAVNAYQRSGTTLAADTMCAFYERFYPRLLELLGTAPGRFQRLLDVTLGNGQAFVTGFSLSGSDADQGPWPDRAFEPHSADVPPAGCHQTQSR